MASDEGAVSWMRGLWVALALASLAFVLLAADVWFGGALSAWDRTLSAGIYAVGDPGAREFLYDDVLSRPGDDVFVFTLLAVVSVLVAYYGDRHRGMLMAASGFLGGAVLKLIKEIVGRGRPNVSLVDGPEAFMVVASERSPAFPSGHVFDTAVIYGLVLWFGLGALMRHRAVPAMTPAVGLALWAALCVAMAVFRVLGGVHWLTDVVASLALAVAWLAGTLLVDDRHLRWREARRRQVGPGPLV